MEGLRPIPVSRVEEWLDREELEPNERLELRLTMLALDAQLRELAHEQSKPRSTAPVSGAGGAAAATPPAVREPG